VFLWILHFINVLLSSNYSFINTEILLGVDSESNNNSSNNSSIGQDPVRYLPSGTVQSWGVIGTALAVHRLTPGSPRVKAIAALGSLTITIPSTVYHHAVENPVGFREFFYTLA
jgi:hypothetical protein